MTIAVIGAGNMGGAIVKGIVKANREDIRLIATARTQETLSALKAACPEAGLK